MPAGKPDNPDEGPTETWPGGQKMINIFNVTPQDLLNNPKHIIPMLQGALTCIKVLRMYCGAEGRRLCEEEKRTLDGAAVLALAGRISAAEELLEIDSNKLIEMAGLTYATAGEATGPQDDITEPSDEREFDA